MKKCYLLLVLCLIGLTFSAYGQNTNLEDVVYLKNGSVIRGTIIEQVPNESIKIQTKDGSLFAYKMNEVTKLTKEANSFSDYRRQTQSRFTPKTRGYLGMVDVGYGFKVGDFGVNRISLSMVNGYKFSPYFGIGVGFGFNLYTGNGETECTLPLFAHLRTNFLKSDITPFASANIGYNVSLSGGYFGGLLFEPTLGVAFRVSNRNQLTVGLCYALSNFKYEYRYGSYYSEDSDISSSIGLKVGITF